MPKRLWIVPTIPEVKRFVPQPNSLFVFFPLGDRSESNPIMKKGILRDYLQKKKPAEHLTTLAEQK